MQQRLCLEDVNMLRGVQPLIPGLQSVTAQAQSSAPSHLSSIRIKRNGRVMLSSPSAAILPVVKEPPVLDLNSKVGL